ncbi:MAG: Lhr family ATP-dependent helicase, partial [Steroidobacteraceae bacterium]
EDARGEPPSIPFWLGEAPGRSDELSASVSRLRGDLETRLDAGSEAASAWLASEAAGAAPAAVLLVTYLAAARAALGAVPTQQTIVFERFFDEAGGMQLIIHSPFGSRINRAWGLSLRKRFCRSFNFELQAAATEDTIVLSLTTAHSFELAEVARYLHSNSVRALLVQALCAAPMFPVRWRWTATIALALPRFRGGKKVPAPLARMAAEDLLAAIFPDQVACAENLPGEIEIPEHPLVRQAIRDCLEDAMDAAGLERLLRALESGSIRVIARDLTEPSPLALEVLAVRPYAYLDDAPLEERRTQAVMSRRWLDPQSAADIGQLDADAIRRVREEAWPDATNADELHDALLWLTCLTAAEGTAGAGWPALLTELAAQRRITLLDAGEVQLWVTAERLPLFQALYPRVRTEPAVTTPAAHRREWNAESALIEIVRGRLEGSGPITAAAIAAVLGLPPPRVDAALTALQAEGFAMRGAFTPPGSIPNEWCERRLLARIHRYTVKRLRAEIEPIEARDFLRFLFEWQRVTPGGRMEGPDAVGAMLAQLEGFEAPASAWETEILPGRISEYEPTWLDEQCLAGRFLWTRLSSRRSDPERGAAPVRATPIVLLARRNLRLWSTLTAANEAAHLSASAQRVAAYLGTHGASFFDEIASGSALLPSQAEEALAELVALGLVNSDSFAGLRALLVPQERRRPAMGGRRRRRLALFGMDAAGRWSRIAPPTADYEASVNDAT